MMMMTIMMIWYEWKKMGKMCNGGEGECLKCAYQKRKICGVGYRVRSFLLCGQRLMS